MTSGISPLSKAALRSAFALVNSSSPLKYFIPQFMLTSPRCKTAVESFASSHVTFDPMTVLPMASLFLPASILSRDSFRALKA